MELLALALILALVLALASAYLARVQKERAGLPAHARVVYADTGAWQRVEKPLFSRKYLLTGKPDYLVEENRALIPIEVKPNRVAAEPRWSDTLQLAAYGLLVAETFGQEPPYGLLKYRDQVFRIDLTAELRADLLAVLEAMRHAESVSDVPRSHADARRCAACGYREECDHRINE
jgi:CRISPR-associated exonuclease Cas4